jgi:hypothetical protein
VVSVTDPYGSIIDFLDGSRSFSIKSLNKVKCEASRYLRNKRRECIKDKINELVTNSKNKNIRDLYRGIN